MPIHTITRSFSFDYAHRLPGHPGKCRNIHGHRGVLEVTLRSRIWDTRTGMLLDFGDFKCDVGKWVDSNWDHALLLHKEDGLWKLLNDNLQVFGSANPVGLEPGPIGYWSPKICLLDDPPTVEVMSKMAAVEIGKEVKKLYKGLEVQKVKLFETENSWAEYWPEY